MQWKTGMQTQVVLNGIGKAGSRRLIDTERGLVCMPNQATTLLVHLQVRQTCET